MASGSCQLPLGSRHSRRLLLVGFCLSALSLGSLCAGSSRSGLSSAGASGHRLRCSVCSLRSGRKSAGVSVFLGLVGSSVLAASVCSGSCWVGFIVAFCACCLLVGAPPSFHTDEASTAETALALPGCLWCCWVLGAVVQWVRLQWGWPSAVSLGARAWWWAYPASWSGRGSSGGRVLRWARAGAVGGAAADRLSSFRLGVRPSTRWASACCRPRLASHSSLPDQPRCLHLVSGLQ